jgi:hypothetical protein
MSASNGQDGARDIPIEPDEIDRLAHSVEHTPTFDPTGRVVRLLITPKDFLPPGTLPDRIIGGQPEGTTVTLGTLAGEIHSVEKHEHMWQEKLLESWWLNGYFQAVNATTGEVFNAPCAALPKAYGLQVATAFRDPDLKLAALGVTIGLIKKQRGGVAYEWFVRDHMTNVAADRVGKISNMLAENLLGANLKQIPGSFDARGHVVAGK